MQLWVNIHTLFNYVKAQNPYCRGIERLCLLKVEQVLICKTEKVNRKNKSCGFFKY